MKISFLIRERTKNFILQRKKIVGSKRAKLREREKKMVFFGERGILEKAKHFEEK